MEWNVMFFSEYFFSCNFFYGKARWYVKQMVSLEIITG